MRKSLYIFLALLGTIALSSCQKTEVVENNHYHNSRSLWFEISQNEWVPNANGDLWTYSRDIPEIDQFIFENGTVLVDISFGGTGIFEPLTTVYNGLAYRYDYAVGNLLIDVTWADGGVGSINNPEDVILKVILLDGDPIN